MSAAKAAASPNPWEALGRIAALRSQQDGKALKDLHPEEFAILEHALYELEFRRSEAVANRFEGMLRTAGRSPK